MTCFQSVDMQEFSWQIIMFTSCILKINDFKLTDWIKTEGKNRSHFLSSSVCKLSYKGGLFNFVLPEILRGRVYLHLTNGELTSEGFSDLPKASGEGRGVRPWLLTVKPLFRTIVHCLRHNSSHCGCLNM